MILVTASVGFLKPESQAILELISNYSPTFHNEFLKKSWRLQNLELEKFQYI